MTPWSRIPSLLRESTPTQKRASARSRDIKVSRNQDSQSAQSMRFSRVRARSGQRTPSHFNPSRRAGRFSVRLSDGDLLLLRERASGRQLPTSTYVCYLIRSHLRNLTPLPEPELAALRQSVAEMGGIGRNLNQIARAWNRGDRPNEPSLPSLHAILRALTAPRDYTKALVTANITSWKVGQWHQRLSNSYTTSRDVSRPRRLSVGNYGGVDPRGRPADLPEMIHLIERDRAGWKA
jgi:Bacterial mobilisation protein (MobC)